MPGPTAAGGAVASRGALGGAVASRRLPVAALSRGGTVLAAGRPAKPAAGGAAIPAAGGAAVS